MATAAYKLPLKHGSLPVGFEQIPIVVDGSKLTGNQKKDLPDKYGWVFRQPGLTIVAFRGTADIEDASTDIEVKVQPYKCVPGYGDVHEGFQEVYFAVRDSVLACLDKTAKIFVTGHSMGGALSHLAAPDILYQLHVQPTIATFAAPRSAKSNFASKFDKDIQECYRIVNVWDPIPRVPSLWTGYRHVGKSVTFNGGFTLDPLRAHSLDSTYRPGVAKLAL